MRTERNIRENISSLKRKFNKSYNIEERGDIEGKIKALEWVLE